MEQEKKSVDIIIPVMNEAQNVRQLCERMRHAFLQTPWVYKIIFVVDTSTDNTLGVLQELVHEYPLEVFEKRGRPGKAFSIIEGVGYSDAEFIAMIDGDLQYPPEAIPTMLAKMDLNGVVVGNRVKRQGHWIRHIISLIGSNITGKLLFGLKDDVQSGLKVFRREIFDYLDLTKIYAWSFDIPLLVTARYLGYSVCSVPIMFVRRSNGVSKVLFLSTSFQIAYGPLKIRLSKHPIYMVPSIDSESMKGAGMIHGRKRFITHSHLPHHKSAVVTVTRMQKIIFVLIAIGIIFGFWLNWHAMATGLIGVLTATYLADVLFTFFLVQKSMRYPSEIVITDEECFSVPDSDLPMYSILCPLYKEAAVLPHFVQSMQALKWPVEKLEILLLLEEDDVETIEIARTSNLPPQFRIVVVPHSLPKTKPKACNYGLAHMLGEYVVIFDAEDQPDALQLRKVYVAFSRLPRTVACLQAKLRYYNTNQNLLTRLFSAEYALWFDLTLPGLQSIASIIPLGGTSNHFRSEDVRALQGWDPFNVTEDCDLGTRLFSAGFTTAIIDSYTLEEANSKVGNWIRQRARWIKGHMQTYLVHIRMPIQFIVDHGWRAFVFHLVVGGKIAFILINPFLWMMTIAYFALRASVGSYIEALYPPAIFYMGAVSLVFGNFLFLYYYLIACAKQGQLSLMKYIYLVPVYWLLISIAGAKALWQLIVKPHFWEKTNHGLHLLTPGKKDSKRSHANIIAHGSVLVIAAGVTSICNFLYNAYLGRALPLEDFGVVTLLASFSLLAQVIFGALTATMSHNSAWFIGKKKFPKRQWLLRVQAHAFMYAFIPTALWLAAAPASTNIFHINTMLPWLLMTPLWIAGICSGITSGWLSGTMRFSALAIVMVTEGFGRLLFAFLLVRFGFAELVVASIPLASISALAAGAVLVFMKRQREDAGHVHVAPVRFMQFFGSSLLGQVATVAILTLDVILAKHFLSPVQAGQYAMLSLGGKMVFFLGNLVNQFTIPLVSRKEGGGDSSETLWGVLLAAGVAILSFGFVCFGVLGRYSIPLLFGARALPIVPYLLQYTLAMALFGAVMLFATYHQARKQFAFSVIISALTAIPIAGIVQFHSSIGEIVQVMLVSASVSAALAGVLHIVMNYQYRVRKFTEALGHSHGKRILIFNWRDTKHVWAGGAEAYLH